ncbi:hypothetical protein [Kocuria oceani]|uniref:hypothetical protein n=1 Tax=Kocuria oceani TaxID=988827 RepID=UPI0024061B01|nr:hypothetical protein [Kocuria oceani]
MHRVSYELFTGQELTPDVELDHICQGTLNCANPAHVQAVTGAQHKGITVQRRKISKADGVIFVPERHTINATQLMFGWEHGLPIEFGGAAFIPPLSD